MDEVIFDPNNPIKCITTKNLVNSNLNQYYLYEQSAFTVKTKLNACVDLEKYEKVKDIGKGSFGRVSLIKRRADSKILVWKELNYGKMSEKEK